jgi:tetratricopeptide (TPR) repeat protein
LLGLTLGGLLWFSPARRQPAPPAAPPPPPPSSLAEADVVAYQRALNQYAAGQFEQAARGFAHLGATSADIEVRSRANLRLLYCYRNLGRQASGRGDLAAAERWLRAAVKLAPENAQARWELHAVRKKIAGARATATASPGLLSAHGGPPDAKP